MLQVSDYLSERTIVPELRAGTPEEALRVLVSALQEDGRVGSGAELLDALVKREEIMSTGLGHGIAIPHAWAAEVRQVSVAVGRDRGGFDYRALDGEPVHLVFLLATPEEDPWLHLQLLARLSRLARMNDLRALLLAASDAVEMREMLRAADQPMV